MVGKTCTVCRISSYAAKDLSFFTYPSDKKRRYEWLVAVDRLDLLSKLDNEKTRANHRICEVHFEQKYVQKRGAENRKYLTRDSMPTLQLERKKTPRVPRKNPIHNGMPVSNNAHVLESYIDIGTCQSDLSHPDISQFCESIIKISKNTQTESDADVLNRLKANKDLSKSSDDNDDQSLFLQICSKFLPSGISTLIRWHVESKNMKSNINSNLFALNLYYSNPHTYKSLKQILDLPTVESLKAFVTPKTTRLSISLLQALKCKVHHMSEREKICSVSVGHMFLKPNLYYHIKYDRIIGFHEVNGEQTLHPATYAIVLMVQGILEDWKQPIAYALISEYDNTLETSQWIDEVMSSLVDIGLNIRCFISDLRSEFLYASDTRQVTADNTFFKLNDKIIFNIYDIDQLVKVVINNAKPCTFHYEDISQDQTENFIEKVLCMSELLNVGTEKPTSNQRYVESQKFNEDFLEHMVRTFRRLKVVRKSDGEDVTDKIKFIEGFLISIRSIKHLFEDLKHLGVKSLINHMRRLSHKCLNHFLKRIKLSSINDECTSQQFNRFYVRSFVHNLLQLPKSKIIEPYCGVENSIKFLISNDIYEDLRKPLKVSTVDYRFGFPNKNVFDYINRYLYLKCSQQHTCDVVKSNVQDCSDTSDENMPLNLGVNSNETKLLCPIRFARFLLLLESKFTEYFQKKNKISCAANDIFRAMDSCTFDTPCPCFPVDYLKRLFVRVRIFYMIKENNRLFAKKKSMKTFKNICL